jgi:hypothetical protein
MNGEASQTAPRIENMEPSFSDDPDWDSSKPHQATRYKVFRPNSQEGQDHPTVSRNLEEERTCQ